MQRNFFLIVKLLIHLQKIFILNIFYYIFDCKLLY